MGSDSARDSANVRDSVSIRVSARDVLALRLATHQV